MRSPALIGASGSASSFKRGRHHALRTLVSNDVGCGPRTQRPSPISHCRPSPGSLVQHPPRRWRDTGTKRSSHARPSSEAKLTRGQADSVFSGISTFGRLPYFPCLSSHDVKYDIAFIGEHSTSLAPYRDFPDQPAQEPRSTLAPLTAREHASAQAASDKVLGASISSTSIGACSRMSEPRLTAGGVQRRLQRAPGSEPIPQLGQSAGLRRHPGHIVGLRRHVRVAS